MNQDDVCQFKGIAYTRVLIRLWWFPFFKKEKLIQIGWATGDEPHLFPAPVQLLGRIQMSRNMIALRFADGWYFDVENNWEGWKRVLSLDAGKMTFHIPDDFKIGDLRQIEPNWDGHTTEEKWQRIDDRFGIVYESTTTTL